MRAALGALSLAGRGQAGPATAPVIQMDYTNYSLSPSHWRLTLHPDGRGHFDSEMGTVRTQGHRSSERGPGHPGERGVCRQRR